MIPLSSWVMSYMSVGHGTHMRESCHTCSSTMSHAWIRMNESHHFFFGSLVWSATVQKNRQTWLIYHVIDVKNLWYTCLMNESCHAWAMSNTCVGHVTWPWLIHTSDVTHSSLTYLCRSLWYITYIGLFNKSLVQVAFIVTHMNMIECFMFSFTLLACLINWHVKKRETLLLHQVTHVNNSVTHILNESCHAWVMSHTCVSPCHVHTWVMSPYWFGCVIWLI